MLGVYCLLRTFSDVSNVLQSRFEEIDTDAEKEEVKEKSKKRPRDSGVSEAGEEKLSKAEKKNKKLKAEDGKAVPAGTKEQPETNGDVKKDKKKEKRKEKDKDVEKEQEKVEKGAEKKEKKPTKEIQGVKITDHKTGTGRQVKSGDTVSMRYIGKLTNGKVFDKNTGGAPVSDSEHMFIRDMVTQFCLVQIPSRCR